MFFYSQKTTKFEHFFVSLQKILAVVMKKFFNLTLLIFAITFVLIGCRKDKDALLVNTWVCKKVEIIEIVFGGSTNSMGQALVAAALSQMISEGIEGTIFEFRADGLVSITPPEGTFPPDFVPHYIDFSYTTKGSELSIYPQSRPGGPPVTGKYSVSKNTLHWDVQLNDLLSFLEWFLSEVEIPDFNLNDLGVQSATVRLIFSKK